MNYGHKKFEVVKSAATEYFAILVIQFVKFHVVARSFACI